MYYERHCAECGYAGVSPYDSTCYFYGMKVETSAVGLFFPYDIPWPVRIKIVCKLNIHYTMALSRFNHRGLLRYFFLSLN